MLNVVDVVRSGAKLVWRGCFNITASLSSFDYDAMQNKMCLKGWMSYKVGKDCLASIALVTNKT